MPVRIRMKKLGRRHRPFYRVCAIDGRSPRDGRVLEELGTYDPMIGDVDARAVLIGDRIDYWIGVGAVPSDKVKVLIKKYGTGGTHLEKQTTALAMLAEKSAISDPGKPAFVVKVEEEAPAKAESATEPPAEEKSAEEAPAKAESATEAPAEEKPAEEAPAKAAAEESVEEAAKEKTEEKKE